MGHEHGKSAAMAHRPRLIAVLGLTLLVLVVEAVAAVTTGSLALLADAAHVLSDSFGLVMALLAISIAGRAHGPRSRRTFGNHRTEILAAGINGLVLVLLTGWIVVSAIRRFVDQPDVDGTWMIAVGVFGLVVNVIGLGLLRSGSKESLNLRGAYLEVLGDALGSVAVIVSAAIIVLTGWRLADPIASLAIAVLIVPRAFALLRDVADVLLESTPRGMDLDDLRAHIVRTDGVRDVHDLHVWTITSGMPVMSAHVVVEDSVSQMGESHAILDRLRDCLAEHFDVDHSTFQIEPQAHADQERHTHH